MNPFSQFNLKEKYRKVLDNLSDEDKIRTTFNKTSNINSICDIITYYELQNNPLHKELAIEKFKDDPHKLIVYINKIVKCRWPEAETCIRKHTSDISVLHDCLHYAIGIKERWPEIEDDIKKHPGFAVIYAKNSVKGRWPEAELYIKECPRSAYEYARDVIHGRWPEAEEYIIKDPEYACFYARSIFQGRWPEAEKNIILAPRNIFIYAKEVIKGRWPEAEDCLRKDFTYWKLYKMQNNLDIELE